MSARGLKAGGAAVCSLWAAFVAVAVLLAGPAASVSGHTIEASNPNIGAMVSATYPGTVARNVAFTTTGRSTITGPDGALYPYLWVVATRPGEQCPRPGFEELVPLYEFKTNGVPVSIQGRNSLDSFGVWSVCAFVTSGQSAFSNPDVYAVGTINVTRACTNAQSSVTRAAAAVRSARRILQRAKSSSAKSRARALVRKRQRQHTAARRGFAALVAKDCPDA